MISCTSLESVLRPGDAVIVDAFGVFWNGSEFYPDSLAAFEWLASKQIPVVILSNATQLSLKAKDKYQKAGLDPSLCMEILTSGEVTRRTFLNEDKLRFIGLEAPRKTYWVYKPAHPVYGSPQNEIFKDTGYREVESLEEADFLYAGIPHHEGVDQTDSHVFEKEVTELSFTDKPMIVANSDRFVQESGSHYVVRQGEIGRIYESVGGKVFHFGKPSLLAFEAAFELLLEKGVSKDRIWMIGDNLETDILGANDYGIRSILVTDTGMTQKAFLEEKEENPSLTFDEFKQRLRPEYRPTACVSHFKV